MESASTIGEELDSFTVLIKNCSKDASIATSETLLDFIKRLTWQENVEIDEAGPNSAFAKFIDVPTDAEEVMEQLRSESFMGIMLDIVQVKRSKKLYVGNLKPNVQSFEICLYLEQPMFVPLHLGDEYQVEILHFDHNKRFALVKIPDDADIDLYLKAQHSDILGEKLHITEYQGKPKQKGNIKTKPRCGRFRGRGSRNCKVYNDKPKQPMTPLLSLAPSSSHFTPSQIHNNFPIAHGTQAQGDVICPTPSLKGLPFIEFINIYEMEREKCQLIKKMLVVLRKKLAQGWKIHIDEVNHRIWMGHCDEMKLKGLMFAVQDLLKNMNSTFLNIPKEFCMTLKSSKGFSFLIKHLEVKQLKAIYYFDRIKQIGMIIGENRDVARSAAEVLNNDFCQITCNEKFIGEDYGWNNFAATLMKNYLVYISLIADDSLVDTTGVKRVVIQGFQSDPNFLVAKNEVEKHLKGTKFTSPSLTAKYISQSLESKKLKQFDHPKFNKQQLDSSQPIKNANINLSPCKKTGTLADVNILNQQHQQTKHQGSSHSQSSQKSEEIELTINISPLTYKFFKTHFSDVVTDKRVKYVNNMGFIFKGDTTIQPLIDRVQLLLPNLREKAVCIQIAGISEAFFNEKDSELRKEISKFELNHEFAIDFKTDKGKNTILSYVYHTENKKVNNFIEMIKEILMGFSKKKFISCDELFAKIGVTNKIMEEDLIKKIMNIQHKYVKVHFDKKLNMVILQGRENFFDYVEKTLNDVSMKFVAEKPQLTNQTKVDMNHPMRFSNLPEFLKMIGHGDIYAPDHWTTYTDNLKNVSSNKGEIILLKPDSKIFKYVSDMVIHTWKSGQVGIGKDASCLNHKNIQIINIYSVENIFQYKRYMTRIKEFCLQNCSSEFSSLCNKFGSILTREVAEKNGIMNLLWEINECHLFHGTRFEKNKAIIDQGLDFRLGSHHALFGQGIYFAESSTKADQYADPKDTRRSGDNLFMFVARVFLGKMYEATKPDAFKRPPCEHSDCSSDTCSKHAMNDSVIGTHTTALNLTTYNSLRNRLKMLEAFDGSTSLEYARIKQNLQNVRPLLFREFVVYDHDKCFPEFLVEYARI